MNNKHFIFIDILRVLGILLILNFHLDMTFPSKMSILSFGGDLGNDIFFMLSGFSISVSIDDSKWYDFGKWYIRRFFKIFPIVFVFLIIPLLSGYYTINSITEFIVYFIFPMFYWYIGAIIIFYFFVFIVEKMNRKLLVFLVIIGVAIHIIRNGMFEERYIIGFFAMVVGCELRRFFMKGEKRIKNKRSIWIGLFCSLITFGLLKFLMKMYFLNSRILHLLIGIIIIVICALLIIVGYVSEDRLIVFFDNNRFGYFILKNISMSTLYIYLLHQVDRRALFFYFSSHVAFPISYTLCMVYAILGGITLMRIEKVIRKRLLCLLKR